MVAHHMGRHRSISRLQSLVGQVFKSKSGSIVRSGLLGVSYPEQDMVSNYDIHTKA
jgi:hypothetical protein